MNKKVLGDKVSGYSPAYLKRMALWSSQEKYRREVDEVIKLLSLQKNDKVLDVGCCSGDGALYMQQRTGCDILGVDPVEEFVKHCKIKAVVGDAQQLPFDGESFDVLTMFHVLGHVQNPRQAFKEACRVLRPGGRMAIVTPNRNFVWAMRPLNWLGIIKYHPDPTVLRYYTPKTLAEDVSGSGLSLKRVAAYGELPVLAKVLKGTSFAPLFQERILMVLEKRKEEFPLVSVTIATHNRAHVLGRALESVFQQTYPNMEVIVLDDCSEDGTPEVIKAFTERHPNLRSFREKAGSMTRAIRRVTQEAQGTYVAPLDDDDFWSDPEKIALQAAFLQEHADHVAVGGGIIRIDEQGRERARYLYPETDEAIRRFMLWYTTMSGVTMMYRRSAWKAVGGSDPKVLYADDWGLTVRLGMQGKLHNLRRYVSTYTKPDIRWSPREARRLELASFEIRKHYRKYYPGFFMGSMFGWFSYFSTFIPGQRFVKPWLSRIWNILRTRFFS